MFVDVVQLLYQHVEKFLRVSWSVLPEPGLSLVKTEVLVARTGKGMTQRQILACIVVRVYTNGKEVSVMYGQMNKTGRAVVATNRSKLYSLENDPRLGFVKS